MIGNPAIITRNTPPIIVNLDKTFEIYFSVSLPGLTPGINPPFSFKFFAKSSGFN